MSLLLASRILVKFKMFPFASIIAIPTVVPGSSPIIMLLTRLAPQLILCS